MKKLINLNFTGATRGIPLMKQYRNLFIILTVALFLTACGGGGGTSLSLESPTQQPSGGGNGNGGNGNGGNGNGGGGSTGNGGTSSGPITISDDPLMDAEKAQMAAVKAQGDVHATASGPISAFHTKTTLSSAMGVSANIGADQAVQDISTIEGKIEDIKRQKAIAEQAAGALEDEITALNEQLREAQRKVDGYVDENNNPVPGLETEVSNLLAAYTVLEDDVIKFGAEVEAIDVVIADQETRAQAEDALADRMEAGTCTTRQGCMNGDPASPEQIAAQRQLAADHRAAAQAKIDAGVDYQGKHYTYSEAQMELKTKKMERENTKTEHDAKEAELTEANNAIATLPNDLATKEGEVEKAKDYVQEIDDILVEFEGNEEATEEERTVSCPVGGYQYCRRDGTIVLPTKEGVLEGWKEAVGDDAAAAESEKAKLVLDLLRLAAPVGVFLPTDAIADLDRSRFSDEHETFDPDHVFARAENKPADTMTFEEIANGNEAWVYHRRSFILAGTTDRVDTPAHTITTGLPQNHPAIALSGLDTTVFVKQDGTSPSYPNTPDGRQNRFGFEHGQLNGIDGTLYCDRTATDGGGCGTYTKSGQTQFLDGWYFTPAVNSNRETSLGYNPAEASFEDSDGDGTYEVVRYVDYGMWLAGADDALKLHRRVGLVGPQVPTSSLTFVFPTPTSATYNGEARGLSARKMGTVYASGHFEADVELVATFGYVDQQTFDFETPSLAGTIDNFRAVAGQGSSHVDTGWSLRLNPSAIDLGTGAVNPSTSYVYSSGSPDNPTGGWSATPYGDTRSERPDGFYGGFNTMFCDGNCNAQRTNVVGAAVGVYSVEK